MEAVTIRSSRHVRLAPGAVSKAAELIAGEPEGTMLRLGVQPGGCAGFRYTLEFTTESAADDILQVFTTEDGAQVTLAVDPESAEMVMGAEIEYEEGLMGAGFSVNNPHVTHSCGCGRSFG